MVTIVTMRPREVKKVTCKKSHSKWPSHDQNPGQYHIAVSITLFSFVYIRLSVFYFILMLFKSLLSFNKDIFITQNT